MAIKDLFNKSISAISKGAEAAKAAAIEKKKAKQEFDLLITKSDFIGPMKEYTVNNNDPQLGKEQMILNCCITLSVENSQVINKLIPVDETVVDVKTGKESKSAISYLFVITNSRLWILNSKKYITYEFGAVKNFEIINKGLMSQDVKFDNKAFNLDGNETDITRFINTLMNTDYRNQAIMNKQKYLCGITPRKQLININLRGISFGDNYMIVLHNSTENKPVSIKEVQTIQLLINDVVVISKGATNSGSLVSNPMEARKISVKFVFGLEEFIIDVLPQNMMNTSYKREDSTYITNFEFAKKIIDTLEPFINKTY